MPNICKISLKTLLLLEEAANVISSSRPKSWDVFDESVPQSLLDMWKEKVEAEDRLKNYLTTLTAEDAL